MRSTTTSILLALSLYAGAASLHAQSAPRAALAALPSEVSFVVRVDAQALGASPMLARLLDHPAAANPLASALAADDVLRLLRTVYIGFPGSFRPSSTEIPVVVVGAFEADEIMSALADAPGVQRTRISGREVLAADDAMGTSYAAALRDGVLAVGDHESVLRMLEGEDGLDASEWSTALGPEDATRHVVGTGRVPVALRGWLQSAGGAMAAPFAAIERVSFEGTLDEAMRVRAALQPTTAEARQGIEQALGALRVFGPSRFANDPEVLSTIQSLRFSTGPKRVDVNVTVPRSLLLRLIAS